jgi:uncharacterized membrane protein
LSDVDPSVGGLPQGEEAAGTAPILPPPDEISSRERDDAMGAYLMMFASLGLGLPLPLFNIIASAIYYFINRKNSRFVAFHALQAFLFHIPVSLFNAATLVWIVIVLVGGHFIPTSFFPFCIFTILLNLIFIIYSLIALVRARRGLFFYIPLFGRLAFDRHYGKRRRKEIPEPRNEAPRGFWG